MGVISSIQRNPFNPWYFMSVGDWTVNVNLLDLGRWAKNSYNKYLKS